MKYALLAIAAVNVYGALFSVLTIGKERKPLTSGIAALSVLLSAAITVVLVLAALGRG